MSGKSWENLVKSQEGLGKISNKSCENLGKIWENILGNSRVILRKILRKPWDWVSVKIFLGES
jgi:hypothetical protein